LKPAGEDARTFEIPSRCNRFFYTSIQIACQTCRNGPNLLINILKSMGYTYYPRGLPKEVMNFSSHAIVKIFS
jgi:hypothetical protein